MTKASQPENPSKGIYLQRRVYWYRYSFGGRQHFFNLRTTDLSEAIEKKRHLIASGALASADVIKKSWEKSVDDYLDKRISEGRIRKVYRGRVKSALMTFASHSKAKTPGDVSLRHLQDYYTLRRKKSEAGARSSINTVQAFLSCLGLLHKRVEFAANSKPESRQKIASMSDINKWIDSCHEQKLKFVLFCLGNCGMRAGEVKHARREWFDDKFVTIPAKQVYQLKDRTFAEWRTKDNDSRQIPLPPRMREFLADFLKGKKGLVNSSKISRDGIWDFKLPLKLHMQKMGRPEFFPHAFRHSWITEMMNRGKTIQQVSAWSGDSIQTLERNYWKRKVTAGETDDVVEGIQTESEAEKRLRRMEARLNKLADVLIEVESERGDEIDKDEALYIFENKPDFVAEMIAELARSYRTEVVIAKMDKEQQDAFERARDEAYEKVSRPYREE